MSIRTTAIKDLIEYIRRRYNPDNDLHKVTYIDMHLLYAIEFLTSEIETMEATMAGMQTRLMELGESKLAEVVA